MLTFILKSGSHRKCNMFSEFNTLFIINSSTEQNSGHFLY